MPRQNAVKRLLRRIICWGGKPVPQGLLHGQPASVLDGLAAGPLTGYRSISMAKPQTPVCGPLVGAYETTCQTCLNASVALAGRASEGC